MRQAHFAPPNHVMPHHHKNAPRRDRVKTYVSLLSSPAPSNPRLIGLRLGLNLLGGGEALLTGLLLLLLLLELIAPGLL